MANFNNDYTINKLTNFNQQHTTRTAGSAVTTITIGASASTDIGMGGVNLQDEQFSISDGSTSVTWTYLQACHESNADCPSATQLKTGSGRTAAEAAAEIATKVNASALNITANASQNVVTLTPQSGASITVTELNDGQLGGSAGDWVAASSSGGTTIKTAANIPFVFGVPGVISLRTLSDANGYKSTLV